MSKSYQTYWRALVTGKRTDFADTLALLFLTPLSWLYSFALQLRALLFQTGILKTYRLPRPVVSIGNITVGGTGKTPATAYIAQFLLAQGYRVAVLSRGYGGTLEVQTSVVSDGATIMLSARECGDEPYLLASTVPGLMVVIGSDRYAAGLMAVQQLSPDVFLLDDGFQHLRLHRDLNILLLDYTQPFGNGLTLPAGLLREPASAASRADLVIYTRTPKEATIPVITVKLPSYLARHTLTNLLNLNSGTPISYTECRDKKVLGFAGIADPESFFGGLRAKGLNLVQCISFPDHVDYTKERCDEIINAMQASGADVLVTTEKDGVKLKGFSEEHTERILLARLELTIDSTELLKGLVMRLLSHTTSRL